MKQLDRLYVLAKLCRRFIMKDGHPSIMINSKINQILRNVEGLNSFLNNKLTFRVEKTDILKNELIFVELLGRLPSAGHDLHLQGKIGATEYMAFELKVGEYLHKIAREAPYQEARTLAARVMTNQDCLMNLASDKSNLYAVRMEAIKNIKIAKYLALVVIDKYEPHELRVLAAKTITDKTILSMLLKKETDVQILATIREQLRYAS